MVTSKGRQTRRSTKTGRIVTVRTSTATGHWRMPKGDSVAAVTRDATKQVIDHYGEALTKLQKH